ncbi:MAG TPA: hypothetical protein VLS88_09575 [Polyangiales bacterium]|nr:hypothetical protein [Polyangiales bacterium]
MRTNVKRSADAGTIGHLPASPPEVSPSELVATETAPSLERPRAGAWAEDWSTPDKQPQMSAIWPLLWLTIPLVLLVLYGLFGGN